MQHPAVAERALIKGVYLTCVCYGNGRRLHTIRRELFRDRLSTVVVRRSDLCKSLRSSAPQPTNSVTMASSRRKSVLYLLRTMALHSSYRIETEDKYLPFFLIETYSKLYEKDQTRAGAPGVQQ